MPTLSLMIRDVITRFKRYSDAIRDRNAKLIGRSGTFSLSTEPVRLLV